MAALLVRRNLQYKQRLKTPPAKPLIDSTVTRSRKDANNQVLSFILNLGSTNGSAPGEVLHTGSTDLRQRKLVNDKVKKVLQLTCTRCHKALDWTTTGNRVHNLVS